MTRFTRRSFLATAAAAVLVRPTHAIAPSDRIRLGFIGVGGQGTGNLKAFLKLAQVVAVCDVDSKRLGTAAELVKKMQGGECLATGDYRAMLDRKDIDAVVVTTPDHWHALPTIHACMAGKDVYCEKPLTLTVREGQAMVAAARKHERVVQTGSQQRSDDKFRKSAELVRNRKLGAIKVIKAGIAPVNYKGPEVPDGAPPAELDYDRWLGPAPQRPYNANRVHYKFRFFWDYSGGQITNWGAHNLDIVQWMLGMDDSGPVSIEPTVCKYVADKTYEVPERCEVVLTYADGTKVICGQGHTNGVTVETEQGSMVVTRGKLESKPETLANQSLSEKEVRLTVSKNHMANFLECVKSRQRPICDVSIGHRSASVCHLANIALRTGRKIQWDPAKEEIVGDAAASAMLARAARKGYELPG